MEAKTVILYICYAVYICGVIGILFNDDVPDILVVPLIILMSVLHWAIRHG